MSWTDIFYPGNAGKRDKVVRLSTKLRTFMELNFDSTNNLINLLNDKTSISCKLSHVTLDDQATVKSNSETLIAKIKEVQDVVEELDRKLAAKLNPDIYQKMKLPDISFKDRISLAKKVISAGSKIAGAVTEVVVVTAISSGVILKRVVAAIGTISTCAASSVVVGVLLLGIDMVASAIIGAVERSKLQDAIEQLETALNEFEPASKEYSEKIVDVKVRLEILLENDDLEQ